MRKKIIMVIAALVLIMVSAVIGIVLREQWFDQKYGHTKLKMSIPELKQIWGEPDSYIRKQPYPNPTILIYQTGFTEYAFTFNYKGKLASRYVGD